MEHDLKQFFEQTAADRARVKEQAPDVVRGFGGFYQAAMKEGALSVREKELICVGISVALRCTNCINLHVRGAVKGGAAREEVLEAAGVGVVMQGGPSYTYLPHVVAVLDYLDRERSGANGDAVESPARATQNIG